MKKYFLFISVLLFVSLSATNLFAQDRSNQWAEKIKDGPMKNLYKVSDILYRAEQPDSADFVYLYKKLGIRSSLCLRTDHSDKKIVGYTAIKPYLIKMNVHHITDAEIVQALKIIKDAPHPIVIHCHHGADRTGVVAAMYRIIFQGWTKDEALKELEQGGFGFHVKYTNIPAYIKHVDIARIKKEVQ